MKRVTSVASFLSTRYLMSVVACVAAPLSHFSSILNDNAKTANTTSVRTAALIRGKRKLGSAICVSKLGKFLL